MDVKQACEHAGVSSEQLFQDAYARYGLIYSIGNAETTHKSWKLHGAVPPFVVRFIKDVARQPKCPQPLLL